MRVLFTTHPAAGHLHPQLPLARALRRAGHAVRFACAPSFAATVERAGFRAVPAGLDWLEAEAERTFPHLGAMTLEEQSLRFVTDIFVGAVAGPLAEAAIALAAGWPPDLVVRDPWEFGGWLAAERLGIPHATAGAGQFIPPPALQHIVGPQLAALRAQVDAPADPSLATLHRYLNIVTVPPGLLTAADFIPPVTHHVRPELDDVAGDAPPPGWLATLAARPTVYATLGTVFNRVPGIFAAILAGLRDEPVNLILTVGRNQDPAAFGPQGGQVHIERYVPQALLLPRCDAVVAHAGMNTVIGALRHGKPLVLIPLTADQPQNARRCVEAGVGVRVPADGALPDAVRAAVRSVLTDARYRTNAARIRDEMAELPGPEHAVALLERLAVEKQPLLTA